MTVLTATRQSGVTCGLDGCRRNLWRTMKPAASLWCPAHGHVIDVFPPAPLGGVAIVCARDGCALVDLEELDAR